MATDKEMLELCHQAFSAIPVAASSRRMLQKIGSKPPAYAGNGSHLLAKEMERKLREHLQIDISSEPIIKRKKQ